MSQLFMIILVGPALTLLIFAMHHICCFSKRLSNFFAAQLHKTLFNRVVIFLDASLLAIAACSWINIYQVYQGTIEPSFSYHVSICFLTFLLLYTSFICAYLFSNRDKLDSSIGILDRIDAIYTGYNVTSKPKASIVTITVSMVRRFTLGYIITFAERKILPQFYFIHFSSLL